jgi:hypothetical protein
MGNHATGFYQFRTQIRASRRAFLHAKSANALLLALQHT